MGISIFDRAQRIEGAIRLHGEVVGVWRAGPVDRVRVDRVVMRVQHFHVHA